VSEDCLHLNISTLAGLARFRSKLLPVLVWFGLVWFGLVWFGLVWFHEGTLRPEYDGRRLAERDMIVVTINYRRGSLGFLVSSPDGSLGNFGHWCKNMKRFWH
jgi:para-nitrobenzyl esterase